MSTNKGDILAERIEEVINSYHQSTPTLKEHLREALADYRRVKPARVPLGPEDVPPGSAIRWPDCSWVMVAIAGPTGIQRCNEDRFIPYDVLKNAGGEINRNDGKGFVRCEKEAK